MSACVSKLADECVGWGVECVWLVVTGDVCDAVYDVVVISEWMS